MTVEELKALLDAGEPPFVLDVREPLELQTAPFPFPVHHVPMREVPQHLDEVPREGTVVVACRRRWVACTGRHWWPGLRGWGPIT